MEKVAVQSSRIRKGGPDPRLEPAQKKFDGENTFFFWMTDQQLRRVQ